MAAETQLGARHPPAGGPLRATDAPGLEGGISMVTTNAAPVALEPVSRLEPLRPLPLVDVQRAMAEYQRGLQALLDDGDWQEFRTRAGGRDRFVKRSGW